MAGHEPGTLSRLSFASSECAKSLHKNGSATRSSPTCGGGPANSYYGYNVFKRLRMTCEAWGWGAGASSSCAAASSLLPPRHGRPFAQGMRPYVSSRLGCTVCRASHGAGPGLGRKGPGEAGSAPPNIASRDMGRDGSGVGTDRRLGARLGRISFFTSSAYFWRQERSFPVGSRAPPSSGVQSWTSQECTWPLSWHAA